MSTSKPAESGNEFGARCVLWHSPTRHAPPELLHALSKQGFGVRAVQSQYGAMAELCLLEGRSPPGRYVLLLVEPESLEGRKPVLEGMRRYAPGAVAWVYEIGANPPLHRYVEVSAPVRPPMPAPTARRDHELRLAGIGPDLALDENRNRADKAEDGLGHLLSDEELAMLLDESGSRVTGSADGD